MRTVREEAESRGDSSLPPHVATAAPFQSRFHTFLGCERQTRVDGSGRAKPLDRTQPQSRVVPPLVYSPDDGPGAMTPGFGRGVAENMVPADSRQVSTARWVAGERRWAWRGPLAGRPYRGLPAGVFGLPAA